MSDSDVSDRDSDGEPRCKSPPESKKKYLDRNIDIDAGTRLSNDNDSLDDSDKEDLLWSIIRNSDKEYDARSRSPSPKRQEITLKGDDSISDDEEDYEGCSQIPYGQQLTLKINCSWCISKFGSCKLNTEGYINSDIYTAKFINNLQFFFRIERWHHEQMKEVYYGVYARVLNYDESQAKVEFRGYLSDSRGESHKFPPSVTFPRKEGFQFLGYICKESIRGDLRSYYRYIPDDELSLEFKVYVQFIKGQKHLENDFKALWKEKKFSDCTLIVRNQEIAAHKAILAARSPYFAKLFENKNSSTRINMDEFEPEMIKELLRFIYTGTTKKLIKYLKQFSFAADKFKIKELQEICRITMESYC